MEFLKFRHFILSVESARLCIEFSISKNKDILLPLFQTFLDFILRVFAKFQEVFKI